MRVGGEQYASAPRGEHAYQPGNGRCLAGSRHAQYEGVVKRRENLRRRGSWGTFAASGKATGWRFALGWSDMSWHKASFMCGSLCGNSCSCGNTSFPTYRHLHTPRCKTTARTVLAGIASKADLGDSRPLVFIQPLQQCAFVDAPRSAIFATTTAAALVSAAVITAPAADGACRRRGWSRGGGAWRAHGCKRGKAWRYEVYDETAQCRRPGARCEHLHTHEEGVPRGTRQGSARDTDCLSVLA